MAGGVGHMGGLTNPRPWRGRCRAGYSNTGGPPLPRKRAPLQKKRLCQHQGHADFKNGHTPIRKIKGNNPPHQRQPPTWDGIQVDAKTQLRR